MAEKKTTKKAAVEKPTVTRAELKDATKSLILEALKTGKSKSNELIDKASALYTQKFGGEDAPNDVKGRVGSVLDVMKKEGEVLFDGGMYALKEEKPLENTAEKPKKTPRKTAKKTDIKEEAKEATTEEKPKAKRATKKTVKAEEKKEEQTVEKTQPLPPAPVQPIAPTAPITPETAPEPIPEGKPKKRGRKPKSETKTESKEEPKMQTPIAVVEEKSVAETKTEETPVVEAQKTENAQNTDKTEETKLVPVPKQKAVAKTEIVDMSFLFGNIKPQKTETKPQEKQAEKPVDTKPEQKEQKQEQKPVAPEQKEQKQEPKTENKTENKTVKTIEVKKPVRGNVRGNVNVRKPVRALTADEKLQEAFLSRLRGLGGDYFEYYSVYLLERYSRRNGRRLESLQITGGDHDGGIDGEIELTDRLGFRETIYIQSKNWNPDKGDEKLWVVGETLLQQFIGACVCRQAKEGKQHCRGIFMTTSRFTPEAKRLLNDTSDKFVGYDGADVFETAKECEFGLVKKNGEWTLDETLLSGTKAFFNMF